MEHVTDISVPVNGKEISFKVMFENEVYTFEPVNDGADSFSIKKEQNQWKIIHSTDDNTAQKAIAALDTFLLSQH